jgi:hypothetical protein
MLVSSKDVPEPSPHTIAHHGIAEAAGSDKSGAYLSRGPGKHTDGEQRTSSRISLFADALEFLRENEPLRSWESQAASHPQMLRYKPAQTQELLQFTEESGIPRTAKVFPRNSAGRLRK